MPTDITTDLYVQISPLPPGGYFPDQDGFPGFPVQRELSELLAALPTALDLPQKPGPNAPPNAVEDFKAAFRDEVLGALPANQPAPGLRVFAFVGEAIPTDNLATKWRDGIDAVAVQLGSEEPDGSDLEPFVLSEMPDGVEVKATFWLNFAIVE